MSKPFITGLQLSATSLAPLPPTGSQRLPSVPLFPSEAARPAEKVNEPRVVRIPGAGNPPLLLAKRADPRAEEQYRIMRTKLLHSPRNLSMIVLSSPGPGDGKTVTATHLAGTLALRGEDRVLLLDGDLRRAGVSRYLGLPNTPGLADLLSGSCRLEDTLHQVEAIPSLWVMGAGQCESNPAELLARARWQEIAGTLRQTFRHVIVDSPPLGVVADCDLISAVADGVILVVRPEHTNRTQCTAAIKVLGTKLVGVIMNCVEDFPFWKPAPVSYYYLEDRGRPSRRSKT